MQPPEGTPSGKALFWFLAWFESTNGPAFEFATQKHLAETVGISEDAVSRIFRNPPEWLKHDDRKASIKEVY